MLGSVHQQASEQLKAGSHTVQHGALSRTASSAVSIHVCILGCFTQRLHWETSLQAIAYALLPQMGVLQVALYDADLMQSRYINVLCVGTTSYTVSCHNHNRAHWVFKLSSWEFCTSSGRDSLRLSVCCGQPESQIEATRLAAA